MDLRDAAAFHQLVLAQEGASIETQKNYLHYQRLLLRCFDERGIEPTLDSLTSANVRIFLDWYGQTVHRTGARHGQVAVRQSLSRIKTFANFCEREGIIGDGRIRVQPPRLAKLLREPFTQAEVSAMWGSCRLSRSPLRDEALLLLLLDTGMRIGEAAGLTMDRLRIDERMVLAGAPGKGRRERLVPLGTTDKRDGGRTVRALRTYLMTRPGDWEEGPVFLNQDGLRLSADAASTAMQRLGEVAGVRNPVPHRLRHTFATWYLVRFPGDELGLRRIIGHVSHDVLADYVHFAQSIIADRAGRASLAEAWLSVPPLARTASRADSRDGGRVETPGKRPSRAAASQRPERRRPFAP